MINPSLFILVLITWFIYARKCDEFISGTLRNPDFSFLRILSSIGSGRLFMLLLLVQFLIYLPVLLYAAIIVGVGIHKHWHLQVGILLLYNLIICVVSARWYLFVLQHPGSEPWIVRWRLPAAALNKFYWTFLVRYMLAERKLLFLIVKLYSCGMLYLMVSRQLESVYDLSMIFLFYSFGLLGHSAIIHPCRDMEETCLSFYRGLPLSLSRRFAQYAFFYLLLFIPEIIVIRALTPHFLHFPDALLLVFLGYSVLLLLNSILFIRSYKIKSYLKIMVILFFFVFLGVLTHGLYWLSAGFLLLAVYLFRTKYYQYERS
jgi:hypothetical protein